MTFSSPSESCWREKQKYFVTVQHAYLNEHPNIILFKTVAQLNTLLVLYRPKKRELSINIQKLVELGANDEEHRQKCHFKHRFTRTNLSFSLCYKVMDRDVTRTGTDGTFRFQNTESILKLKLVYAPSRIVHKICTNL